MAAAAPLRSPATYAGHTDQVTCLTFSPVGPGELASGSRDHTIKVWLAGQGTGKEALVGTLTGHTEGVRSIAYSPDGGTIASASDDGTVRLWDADAVNGRTRPTAVLKGHTGNVRAVAFSPDGKTLASAGYDAVKLWTIT